VCVGRVDKRGRDLVETAKQCTEAGIKVCAPNVPLYEIGIFYIFHNYCYQVKLPLPLFDPLWAI